MRSSADGVRWRWASTSVAAIAVVVAFASGCSSDDKPAATAAATSTSSRETSSLASARTAACRPVPPAGAMLSWLPADLPLPDGSYAVEDQSEGSSSSATSATHRGLIAVHGSVDEFVAFVNSQWIPRGWTLGKGDAEEGEAEGGYRRAEFGGVFRVRDVYCDPAFTELLLVYGPGSS